ncbi:MAG: Zn-finger nucleic acid-binding protein [Gammaproteobacteria bacterium]|jgi:Zn-finger nucleic acid-binding protein
MTEKTCPRDDHKLVEGDFHEVPVLHCPDCDGVLIKQMSLMKLLTEMAKELNQDISFESDIDPVEDKGGKVNCPGCYSLMENYGYMGSNDVMIDCCGQCSVLWIDSNELATMCFMNERANKRIDHQHEAAKEQSKRLDKFVLQDALRGAYMRGLRMGYGIGFIF